MNEKMRLKACISTAFELLYLNDMHLICNEPYSEKGRDERHHVGERSIVFRYAHYLQNLINEDCVLKKYDLDCEYNRNGIECKALPSFPNGTFPDLIIHKRKSNDCNLLIMEFKTYWNDNRKNDKLKIKEFMDQTGEYKFKYGVSVFIGWDRPIVEWISGCSGNGM